MSTPPSDTEPQTPGPRFKLGETPRQAGMLFSAHTGSMALSFLASFIQARWMEPAELGRFTFCLSIVTVIGLLFELGIFPAGARVLALAEDLQSERRALGALVLITLAIGAIASLFIAAAALPIDLIFKKDVRWLFISTAAFAFFQPFQLLVEQSCQGLNRIRQLSLFHLLASGFNLLILTALAIADHVTAGSALVAYLVSIGVAAGWSLVRLRPSFNEPISYIKLTLKEARGYGLNMYLARIAGTVSTQVDKLVITYFVGLTPLGLYAIAQKLSNPIVTISRAVAITRFRAFVKLSQIPGRINRWNAGVLIASSVALVVFGPTALKLIFPKYSEAVGLLAPFAVYSLFAGLFQPYNAFLSSHGRGSEVRNIAVIVTMMGFAGLILTVPSFGVTGAAWTGAAVMALDYLLHLYYYQRFRRTLSQRVKFEGDQAKRR